MYKENGMHSFETERGKETHGKRKQSTKNKPGDPADMDNGYYNVIYFCHIIICMLKIRRGWFSVAVW